MDKLGATSPHLAEHCYFDRDWVWYCGPSLQKREADRTTLKKLGFRWSKGGHVMPDGTTVGSWGHSCQKPMFPKRKAKPATTTTFADELAKLGL